MVVGFTGTRKGMTVAQMKQFRIVIQSLNPVDDFHHGNAAGADKQAHLIVLELKIKRIYRHPAGGKIDHGNRLLGSTVSMFNSVSTYAHRPPLIRNHDIVDAADVLVACPKGKAEELRSGTWATIRYAWAQHCRTVLIYPDGTTSWRNQ